MTPTRSRRSQFDLSHRRHADMRWAGLYPILVEETCPSDSWKVKTSIFLRMAPMQAPIMSSIKTTTHFFFVPMRLVWDNWEDFYTGGESGVSNDVVPTIGLANYNYQQFGIGTLADHMGVGTSGSSAREIDIDISVLPFRAYQMIWNEFYRDQNLQTPIDFSTGDTVPTHDEGDKLLSMRGRAWGRDYFTNALPWPQKGPVVEMPIGDTAPLMWKDPNPGSHVNDIRPAVPQSESMDGALGVSTHGVGQTDWGSLQATLNGTPTDVGIDPTQYETDLSAATGRTIPEIRTAFRLQEWLETNARSGSRYVEALWNYFRVKSSDARLQRPEYLGGGSTPVSISEVLQTSESDITPQGNMAGHGVAAGSNHGFRRAFEEHGYIIGIQSILPKTAYTQGTRSHFLKKDKFEFFHPHFSHVGEQPIKGAEIYADDNVVNNYATFGYQQRYQEYCFIPDSFHGEYKDTLAHWHLGRIFPNRPNLNDAFLAANPSTRIFSVPSGEQFYTSIFNKVRVKRPIPRSRTPKF